MDNGAVAWTAQAHAAGRLRGGLRGDTRRELSGREDLGPDFDFGNSAILATLPGGRELLVIGSKSGIGWAVDPDRKGAVVWQYRAGQGSALGGMEWGSAVDGELVYFPVSDVLGKRARRPARGEARRRASAPGSRRRRRSSAAREAAAATAR